MSCPLQILHINCFWVIWVFLSTDFPIDLNAFKNELTFFYAGRNHKDSLVHLFKNPTKTELLWLVQSLALSFFVLQIIYNLIYIFFILVYGHLNKQLQIQFLFLSGISTSARGAYRGQCAAQETAGALQQTRHRRLQSVCERPEPQHSGASHCFSILPASPQPPHRSESMPVFHLICLSQSLYFIESIPITVIG